MSKFQVSVVIPVHNKVAHISRCLESVLSQHHPPAEIIVIDDASSDGSTTVIESFAMSSITIHTRQTPGPGGYAARNLGVRLALSPWVVFIDADDTWLPNHLSSMRDAVAWAGESNVDVVVAGYSIVSGGAEVAREMPRLPPRALLSEADILSEWAAGRMPMAVGAVGARRQALLDAGLFPENRCRRGGDKDLWVRLIAGRRCVFSAGQTARYHVDAENMVTKTVAIRGEPCIAETLLKRIQVAPPNIVRLLASVYLHEVYKYRRVAARRGEFPNLEIAMCVTRRQWCKSVSVRIKLIMVWTISALMSAFSGNRAV